MAGRQAKTEKETRVGMWEAVQERERKDSRIQGTVSLRRKRNKREREEWRNRKNSEEFNISDLVGPISLSILVT